ncbi:unnamed protein product [Notodromas monacha]|uniref:Uncharacterized protein n=1 Tax=Notodromas monacha TaxID=399045 RepID=A0A7R9GI88_9CRUS|nr:unnamed protein product [Notodromas monacha]CAG0921529.1 unnamed protein product [Notodromas monacha]
MSAETLDVENPGEPEQGNSLDGYMSFKSEDTEIHFPGSNQRSMLTPASFLTVAFASILILVSMLCMGLLLGYLKCGNHHAFTKAQEKIPAEIDIFKYVSEDTTTPRTTSSTTTLTTTHHLVTSVTADFAEIPEKATTSVEIHGNPILETTTSKSDYLLEDEGETQATFLVPILSTSVTSTPVP